MKKNFKVLIDSDYCSGCANYLFDLKCTAFPDRIPDAILEGRNAHKKPYRGQKNDITYIEKIGRIELNK